MSKLLLKGIKVYEEASTIERGYVRINDGKIVEVGKLEELLEGQEEEVLDFSMDSTLSLLPGFIDGHIHGADGFDTMDATEEALERMAAILPKEGTTSFLATTITQSKEAISAALHNVKKYQEDLRVGAAELLGVHLEGPFISPHRAGAQPVGCIVPPSVPQLHEWYVESGQSIKVVTVAPEEENGMVFVERARELGITVSIGHSDARYQDMVLAYECGANQVTHLYNQMRGMHHREPGVVGAALSMDGFIVELIPDGVHVHPQVMKTTFKAKGAQQITLITDSMRAKWLADGRYELGGQEVTVKGDRATVRDGTLAGSVLKMNEGIHNMMTFTGCSVREAILMASQNPAGQLGVLDRKGSIRVGKDADLVVVNDSMDVLLTCCRGKIVYRKEGW
ncbi:N-acetylglucosamine-6-phosphate deacetylase [Bacillus coahuilensis]|uniref:N-acetylglucosamine-6-phosphate deacetylase n=1 Tax=Bacillus coahuilensis TaxID=408580 RepID=UPI0001850A14|nr:N-acetylglucosamine-6-phosphate deacetylase [Bacillus coahuilensis]